MYSQRDTHYKIEPISIRQNGTQHSLHVKQKQTKSMRSDKKNEDKHLLQIKSPPTNMKSQPTSVLTSPCNHVLQQQKTQNSIIKTAFIERNILSREEYRINF